MSRILRVPIMILSIASACAEPITYPLEGWLQSRLGIERLDPAVSFSIVNLGGGGVVQRSLQGPAYFHWWSPPADCCMPGLKLPPGAVETWFAPTPAEWNDRVAWRITLPLSGARVAATETVRSDDFGVDASASQELLSLLVRTYYEWHLHPLDWGDTLPGDVRGSTSSLDYRVYWRQGEQLPVMLYSWAWDPNQFAGDGWSFEEAFHLPAWEDVTFECDEEHGCWVSDSTWRAQGVLWWERTAQMELSYIPDVPEPGSHWLVLAGLAAILTGREFRRGMR